MAALSYKYVIVGGGLAGAGAVEGIREVDKEGSILLVGAEGDAPYDRPPLTKQLWTGGKRVEEIFVHPAEFYAERGVALRLGTRVAEVDVVGHHVREAGGAVIGYEKLLLATGGTPRRLGIPGGELEGVNYYRTLGDYRALRAQVGAGKSAVVIGGGFIGSEIAAALTMNQVGVTMIFPDGWVGSRVFPEGLGRAITEHYREKGVRVLAGERAGLIERSGERYVVQTVGGKKVEADVVVVGVGIVPNVGLAEAAGLTVGDGIVVDAFLRTSDGDVYAAGDVAYFPEEVLGSRRVEHWDNAVSQGKQVGRNMAGANERFTGMPFFFSDLFEFGYEAVGDVDSRLETFADWKEENRTGVIYYVGEGRVRGAMMCNVWEKVDAARALIRKGERVRAEDLRGAIALG